MKIVISKEKKIEDLKQEFNAVFPNLQIDFKLQPNLFKKNLQATSIGIKLGDILKDNPEGVICIEEQNSIKEITRKFKDNFGIQTQFFRKSGNLWLEIKNTVEWSLKMQNEKGMEVY